MKKLIIILFVFSFYFSFGQSARIRELQTEGTAEDNICFIVDRGIFTRAKKMLLNVVTSLERTAREDQDNVIENGCGLENNGDFVPDETSNYIRSSDFATYGISTNLDHADYIMDDIIAGHRMLIHYDADVCATGCDYTLLSAACSGEATYSTIIVHGETYTESADITIKAGQKVYFDGATIDLTGYQLEAGGDASELYGTITLQGGQTTDGRLINIAAGYDELYWLANILLEPSGAAIGDLGGIIATIYIDSDYSRFRFTMKDITYDKTTGLNRVFSLEGNYSKYDLMIDNVTQDQNIVFNAIYLDNTDYCIFNVISNGTVNGNNTSDAIYIDANADYNTFEGISRENDDDIQDGGTGTETDELNATIP